MTGDDVKSSESPMAPSGDITTETTPTRPIHKPQVSPSSLAARSIPDRPNRRRTGRRPPEFGKGDVVDRYRVTRVIRAGGFGAVYEARDVATGEPLALKVLHSEFVHSQSMKRFQHEAQILTDLGHPNIVKLLGLGSLPDGRPYLVMELLGGCDVGRELERAGRFSPTKVWSVLEPLCSALQNAHARGIIHRDIKPSNVFLADDPGSPGSGPDGRRVVLLDFGIAKKFRAEALTLSGQAVGTLPCMAPEQLRSEPVDERTDVYGVGVLMFTMLTGELPFGRRAGGTMTRILSRFESSPRVSQLVSVHRDLDELVARAMSNEPNNRFRSVADLARAYRPIAEREALGAGVCVVDPGARSAPCVIVVAELVLRPEVLAEPDDDLLEELESILPMLTAELEAAGFHRDAETGNTAVFTTALPRRPDLQRAARKEAIEAILAAFETVDSRAGADERIALQLMLDIDEAGTKSEHTAAEAGEIVPPHVSAVAGTADVMRDIDIPRQAVSGDGNFCLLDVG